jgi:hypothetical protein
VIPETQQGPLRLGAARRSTSPAEAVEDERRLALSLAGSA